MVLVDTSVWIDHLKHKNETLTELLLEDEVLTHNFVLGELSCGSLKGRRELLSLMQLLPYSIGVGHSEVLYMVEENKLSGSGIGWIDAHLIASAKLSGAKLWTSDKALSRVSTKMKISFS